ncbi:glycosyltransferase [Gluconobacter wancherniae]|nr:glycosyltransferase [Gluconobacter wancherniae]MBS1093080.1 glycosyltransferase [Gluconobacter wancherniae]
MKVLHCLSTHEFAGTERHVAELVSAQMADSDVTLLLENQTRDRLTGGDITDVLPPGLNVIRAGRGGYLLKLAKLVRKGGFDVVHTHLGRASARATWLKRAGIWNGTPLVATLHTSYRARSYGVHDGLICIASWQQNTLPPLQRARSTLIPNWTVAPTRSPEEEAVLRRNLRQEWDLSDDCFVFGAVGRMVEEKDFSLLLKAWRLAALPENAVLLMIGDGPERPRLEEEIKGTGRVIFTGFRTDMPDALAGFDAFVLPSRHEPFGLVLLEAMGAGLPVRAAASGGVLDILKNDPDCLVAPQNIQALSDGLHELYGCPRRTWDLSGFSLDQQIPKLDRFYRDLSR